VLAIRQSWQANGPARIRTENQGIMSLQRDAAKLLEIPANANDSASVCTASVRVGRSGPAAGCAGQLVGGYPTGRSGPVSGHTPRYMTSGYEPVTPLACHAPVPARVLRKTKAVLPTRAADFTRDSTRFQSAMTRQPLPPCPIRSWLPSPPY